MNHASLFSGIGGFDLAAEWMGWTNVFHVEKDPFCQSVLQYHFPQSKAYDDVKTFDGTQWRGTVDILTGGFPCQPYSNAGMRLGKNDERHLWPEMLRIISEVAPSYVVGENVRGLVSWSDGLVFEEVCSDLEGLGYEVWTGIIPAAGLGAPHKRDRIWFVASHPERFRLEHGKEQGNTREGETETRERIAGHASSKSWTGFPTQPTVCGGDDGLPGQLDGITFSKWRKESVKAYGNAVVPQVVYQIFNAIEDARLRHH